MWLIGAKGKKGGPVSFDLPHVTKSFAESHGALKDVVRRHLSDQSLKSIAEVFGFFGSASLLETAFKPDLPYRELRGKIVSNPNNAMDNDDLYYNQTMPVSVSTSISMILASVFSLLIFSTMQLYKSWFAASQINTIICGYLGSWLFIFSLTAVNNLESVALGDGFQSKFFPEIVFSLMGAVFACSTVHRVSATTCFIFSIIGLYFVNKISQRVHNMPVPTEVFSKKKRK